MTKIYSVYTSNVSYKPEFQLPSNWEQGHDIPIYQRRIRADNRLEALNGRTEVLESKGKVI